MPLQTVREILKELEDLRVSLDLSQDEVAQRARLSRRTYQRYENGEAIPKLDDLLRLWATLCPSRAGLFKAIFPQGGAYSAKALAQEFVSNPNIIATRVVPMADNLRLPDPEIRGVIKALATTTPLENVGYWEWNIDDGTFYWSPPMFPLYAMAPNTTNVFDLMEHSIYPPDRAKINLCLFGLLKKGIPYHSVHRVIRKSPKGEVEILHTLRAMARLTANSAGKTTIFGIAEKVSSP